MSPNDPEPSNKMPWYLVVGIVMFLLAGIAFLVAMIAWRPTSVLSAIDEARLEIAAIKVRIITTAVDKFYREHSVHPDSLEQLLARDDAGRGPYLKQEDLLDPWGHWYRYDQTGPRNSQLGLVNTPDVYTIGPGGREVGNWKPK